MRGILIAALIGLGLLPAMPEPLRAQSPTPAPPPKVDEAKFGVYPIAWREIIMRWLETELLDAASAKIEWGEEPKTVELKGRDGEMFNGYVVHFRVNSRNRFGTYTGFQSRRVFIRNGAVAAGGRAPSQPNR